MLVYGAAANEHATSSGPPPFPCRTPLEFRAYLVQAAFGTAIPNSDRCSIPAVSTCRPIATPVIRMGTRVFPIAVRVATPLAKSLRVSPADHEASSTLTIATVRTTGTVAIYRNRTAKDECACLDRQVSSVQHPDLRVSVDLHTLCLHDRVLGIRYSSAEHLRWRGRRGCWARCRCRSAWRDPVGVRRR